MAVPYTKSVLEVLNKNDLIDIVLSLQSKLEDVLENMSTEIKELNSNFARVEAELAVARNVNNKLMERVVDTERQTWATAQYSRRECLEIVGVPRSVPDNEIETKVCGIFQKIGCEITSDNIEACHRLKNKDRVIIKFSRRKDCQHVLSVKKDLKNLDLTDLDICQ